LEATRRKEEATMDTHESQRASESPSIAAEVERLALAEVPDATVARIETEPDGDAAYEAHLFTSDGTPVTVYVSEDFVVLSVHSAMPGPAEAAAAA
jgi:hypothetical protein